MPSEPSEPTEPFTIEFVPGVSLDRWLRTWAERQPGLPLHCEPVALVDQLAGLREGTAAMCFVRLPIERDGLHVIPLYREDPVVVAAREHPVAAYAEIDVGELGHEPLLQDPDEVPEWRAVADPAVLARSRAEARMTVEQAIAVAAAGTGIVILPLSVARLHHRKDVVHRPVTGVAGSQVGLAWRAADEDPRIETFIGIVRGRTAASSRGRTAASSRGRTAASTQRRRDQPPVRRGRRGRAGPSG